MNLQVKPIRKLRTTQLAKTHIIFGGHKNINVVIPRNETFVANRPQKRPIRKPPGQTALFANSLEFMKDTHLKELEIAQGDPVIRASILMLARHRASHSIFAINQSIEAILYACRESR